MTTKYSYTKSPVSVDRLTQEIQQSTITIVLDHITIFGEALDIYFKADLPEADKATLDAIIPAHTGEPFPAEIPAVALDTPKDPNNRPQFRQIVTRPEWLYSPRSLDWTTSKYLSLYNRKHDGAGIDDGTDIGDGWMNFYDTSGAEMVKGAEETPEAFQARLDTNCIKTLVSFEKEAGYDITSASFYLQNEPTERSYLWCIFAPDVPESYGGSKAFMGGGVNYSALKRAELVVLR